MAIKTCPKCGSPGVVNVDGIGVIGKPEKSYENKEVGELCVCRICGESFIVKPDKDE